MALLLRFVSCLLAFLPLCVTLFSGRVLGWLLRAVIHYHRGTTLAGLKFAFPASPSRHIKKIIKKVYTNLGITMAEMLRLAGGSRTQLDKLIYISPESMNILKKEMDRKKGAIILTAHFGNWNLLACKAPAMGFPLTIIAREIQNKFLNAFWKKARTRYGVNVVPAHNSYRLCLRQLKENGIIGFMLDLNMNIREGIFVDFFGRPACTSPGLAFMAAHTGAPVIPVFISRRAKGRHLVEILPPLEPPAGRSKEHIRQATQQYTNILQDRIGIQPEQWMWIHNRWKTKPGKKAGKS